MLVSNAVIEASGRERWGGVPKPQLLLPEQQARFWLNYNRHPFMFDHGLTGHELFELPSLLALARRMPDHRDTYWSNGKPRLDDRWERNSAARLSLEHTITGIAGNNSMVILKHAEQDRVYAPLLSAFLSRVVDLAGDVMRRDVVVGEVLILLSSPDRLTPYHMDAEVNFLVQLSGDKTVHVYDHTNPALVTDCERERYFAGDHNSVAFREGKQEQAAQFELNAGSGVHIPVFAPHWVQTHANVSVALSVNFELRSVKRLERIYRANRLLRRAKLTPSAPGSSPLRERTKILLSRTLTAATRLRHPLQPTRPGWKPQPPVID